MALPTLMKIPDELAFNLHSCIDESRTVGLTIGENDGVILIIWGYNNYIIIFGVIIILTVNKITLNRQPDPNGKSSETLLISHKVL